MRINKNAYFMTALLISFGIMLISGTPAQASALNPRMDW